MKVGQGIETRRAGWSFDDEVAQTFVEHVRRSVPLYDEGHELVCALSDYFLQDGGVACEIGTSTGQLLRKLVEHHPHKPNLRWVGIDPVAKMIAKAKEHLADLPNVELHVAGVLDHEHEKTDLFVSYYCIQFIPPRDRQQVFNLLYERLNWGGALILFEKVRGPDARFQDILVSLYNDFKIKNGFSADEVLNKTASLKGVLEPFSTEGNLGLLRRAGFTDVMTVMKYLCFEGFLAIK